MSTPALRRRLRRWRAAGLLALALLAACRDGGDGAAPGALAPTTTVLDGALPSAAEIGPGYAEEPVAGGATGPCSVALGGPGRASRRSFVSNAAQERIHLRIVRHDDAGAAQAAFAAARAGSSCRASAFDEAAGKPKDVAVEGARASFAIGFADQNDATGATVALAGATVVVVESTLHHGAATAEPLGSTALASRVVARLH